MTVEITRKECVIKRNGVPVATGKKKGSLLYLNVEIKDECHVAAVDTELWHRRLGHASYGTVNAMVKDGRLTGVKMKTDTACEVCAAAKQVRKTFKVNDEDSEMRESARSDAVVCSDVVGPITPASRSGFKYIVTFIRMKSRYVTIYPLRQKSDVLDALSRYVQDMKTLSGTTIKVLRSDNGGEYRNAGMDRFCKLKSIKQEYTVPYNPEQNGMAERMNRTLVEMTRCMLKDSGLNKSYWCEAMMTAADIRNVLSNASNNSSSPFETFHKKKPNLDHMRVFGETCYAHIPKEKHKKLDDTGIKCYFLGYEKNHKAYRLLHADDGSIVISRSVTFTGHREAKAPEKQTRQIFDVDDNEDMVTSSSDEVEEETPTSENALRTPPMQARQGLTHEH